MKQKLLSLLALTLFWASSMRADLTTTTIDDKTFFQITNGDDLVEFAGWVKAGHYDANAILTADIDMDDKSISDFPIGDPDASKRYIGTFDGDKHKISNFKLINKSAATNFGMFNTNTGVVLKNFWLDSSCEIEGTEIVSLIGRHDGGGTFEGLGNCANVTGTNNNIGGLFGAVMGNSSDKKNVYITNCWTAGKVTSTNTSASNYKDCGALSGWFNNAKVTITNFWTIAEVKYYRSAATYIIRSGGGVSFTNCKGCYSKFNASTQEKVSFTAITDEQVESGELCYRLNGSTNGGANWYQTIGTDNYPIPFSTSKRVYYKASSPNYINFDVVDDKIQIENVTTLIDFAAVVNAGGTALNAELTDDIDMDGADISNFPIGSPSDASIRYTGVFDGLGHKISNFQLINSEAPANLGMFNTGANVTLKNFWLDETCAIQGTTDVGGIVGCHTKGTATFEGLGFCGSVSGTTARIGGLIGNLRPEGSSKPVIKIKNCWTKGTVSATEKTAGALCGWVNYATMEIENCWTIANVTNPASESKFIYNCGSDAPGTPSHCFCNKNKTVQSFASITDADVTSGKLCYKLNGETNGGTDWYQTLAGTDAQPYPYDAHKPVYQYSASLYTNLPVSDGKVQISNADELITFAKEVNAGSTTINAEMTTDIDLDGVVWIPIGNASVIYTGTFDGQNKSITNFSYTATSDYNGLFGFIKDATVKNFSISGSLTSDGYTKNGVIGNANGTSKVSGIHSSLTINVSNKSAHSGGIVGGDDGNDSDVVLVEGCEYSGTMTHSGAGDNQAGILGYTGYGGVKNCIFSGTIIGETSTKYGGILGYTKRNTFLGVQNCLSIGKIVAPDGCTTAAAIIANYNGSATENIKNNYYLLKDGSTTSIAIGNKASSCEAPHDITAEGLDLASGEVCAKLGYAFHQNIGTDANPTLDKTKGYVTEIKAAGWSTQYITDSDVTIPSGIEAFAGVVNTSAGTITLAPISDAIAAEEPVILRGAAGLYNFMPTTGASEATSNSLLGSDGTVTGGSNIYALAKLGEPATVGFYPLTDAIKIPAGRAYLEYTAPSPVKGFTFVFDDEDPTGIIEVQDVQDVQGAIFNLAGQRISKMQKGINIVNGRKVLF